MMMVTTMFFAAAGPTTIFFSESDLSSLTTLLGQSISLVVVHLMAIMTLAPGSYLVCSLGQPWGFSSYFWSGRR